MDEINIKAFRRFPASADKSNLWRFILLVLLVSFIVYLILISQSYITAFTFLLLGVVYYIYETSVGTKESNFIKVKFNKSGIMIDNNFFDFESITNAKITRSTSDVFTITFGRKKNFDIPLYIHKNDLSELGTFLESIPNLKVSYKDRDDLVNFLIHILRI